MSRASEWARRQPKEIHLRQTGSPYSTLVFPVIEGGKTEMRIDNAGPFSRRESLRLARWILDTFGNEPAGSPPR